jgi:diketogulonate reductase-like aldo/keto reductase
VWSFCRLLGLKQIDLVIIHAPYHGYGEPYSNCSKGPAGAAARRATWRGMEKAVKDGLTRTIGLSNFDVEYMNEIMEGAEIPPAVNQVGPSSPLLYAARQPPPVRSPPLLLLAWLPDDSRRDAWRLRACSAACVSATSRMPQLPSRSSMGSHTRRYAHDPCAHIPTQSEGPDYYYI